MAVAPGTAFFLSFCAKLVVNRHMHRPPSDGPFGELQTPSINTVQELQFKLTYSVKYSNTYISHMIFSARGSGGEMITIKVGLRHLEFCDLFLSNAGDLTSST